MKKWTEEEDSLLLKYFNEKNRYNKISILMNRTYDSIRGRLNKLGFKISNVIDLNKKYVECKCKTCNKLFKKTLVEYKKSKSGNHFCSHTCSASYNNLNVVRNINGVIHYLKKDKYCLNCGKKIKKYRYCNNSCYAEHNKKTIFNKIENKIFILEYKNTESRWVKTYLIEKYGEKCMKCGWNEKHPITSKIPIQLNHIDGNSENNNLNNVELLCPNCHSLTSTYGSLNAGKGRTKRKEYRIKQKQEKGFYI